MDWIFFFYFNLVPYFKTLSSETKKDESCGCFCRHFCVSCCEKLVRCILRTISFLTNFVPLIFLMNLLRCGADVLRLSEQLIAFQLQSSKR